ncbi:hypothetical protein P4388_32005 [Bacillus thuringiensis]|uniref:hypothetical protein n=1 Tax=Bacillus cereus group TaxID=86661 RepID=UPI001596FC48|nr:MULTISPECIES: hypothetical protein [Bacillus cereus group]MEB9419856.1 hypothetical protein [Bacillus cereus]MED1301892.1 hypothetical protein [Bacillus pacificus]MED3353139.1 hypothetical protein [Bacillus thuringiensis]
MAAEKLVARIRKDDHILREHFDKIKSSDHPYEIRRLLEKAIKMEKEEQELIEKAKKQL